MDQMRLEHGRSFRKFLCAAGVASALIASAATAQQVSLRDGSGSMQMDGELLDFDGEIYTIQTQLGVLNIRAEGITCVGAGCPSDGTVASNDFVVKGSSTIGADLLPLMIKTYAATLGAATQTIPGDAAEEFKVTALEDGGYGDPLFTADIETYGSGSGISALLNGTTDIAMAARRMRSSEVRTGSERGLGDLSSPQQEFEIGVDSLLIITHYSNPVTTLTTNQLTGILSGRITNWSEVGGEDLPIQVYTDAAEGSATISQIAGKFLRPFGAEMTSNAIGVPNGDRGMAEAVDADPSGISFTGAAFKGDDNALTIISECGIPSTPTIFATKTGEYDLARKLYIYVADDPLPQYADEVLKFALSAEADGIVAKTGFINYAVQRKAQEEEAEALRPAMADVTSPSELNLMRELYVDMLEWDRLSTTLRFTVGSTRLDNTSLRDLERFLEYLDTLPDGTRIKFVGFTDSDGAFDANSELALTRATAVQDQVLARLSPQDRNNFRFEAKGYGELRPVGCNSDFFGQQLNRRVEVWINTDTTF